MKHLNRLSSCTVLLYFSLFPAFSQQTPETIIDSTKILETVVVKGFDKGEELSKQSAAISYMDAKEFEQFSTHNPVMAWNTLPGFNLEQRAVSSYRVSIRGSSIRSPFGVRNVKVYWNGLPFTEANGTTALNLLSTAQMQQIEVIRGPSGSLYGAGIGGVMRLGNFPNVQKNLLSIQLNAGSYNRFGSRVNTYLEKGKVATFASVDRQQADGFRDHNALNRQVYQSSTRLQLNDRNKITGHLLFTDLYYEIPGGLNENQLTEDPRQARPGSADQQASILQKTTLAGLNYTSYLSDNFSQSTWLNMTYTDFQNPFILDYKKDYNTEFAVRNEWQWDKQYNSNWESSFVFGFESQYGNNLAKNFGNVDGESDTLRFADDLEIARLTLFAQGIVEFADWRLLAGLSHNQLQYTVDRYASAIGPTFDFTTSFEAEWLPRIALQYQWNDNIMNYFAISEGFSSPTLDEIRTNEGSINESLQAERGRNIELGTKINTQKLSAELILFHTALRETITTYTNPDGVVLFRNAGATDQKGIEASLRYNLMQNTNRFFSNAFVAATYQFYNFEFKDYQQEETDLSGNQLTGVPQHTLNLTGGISILPQLHLNFQHRYVSETPLTDENDVYASSYNLLNGKIRFEPTGQNSRWSFALSVENIFDNTYSLGNDLNAYGGRYFQPAPGRNYHASIGFQLP